MHLFGDVDQFRDRSVELRALIKGTWEKWAGVLGEQRSRRGGVSGGRRVVRQVLDHALGESQHGLIGRQALLRIGFQFSLGGKQSEHVAWEENVNWAGFTLKRSVTSNTYIYLLKRYRLCLGEEAANI